MCALFGWLDYKHIVPYKVLKTLKKLTQALANVAEERETDAAGISYVRDGRVTIFKRPKPTHKIRFNAPDDTTAIMGHTRLTTQGNQKFNQNNHPFPGHADKKSDLPSCKILYISLIFRLNSRKLSYEPFSSGDIISMPIRFSRYSENAAFASSISSFDVFTVMSITSPYLSSISRCVRIIFTKSDFVSFDSGFIL